MQLSPVRPTFIFAKQTNVVSARRAQNTAFQVLANNDISSEYLTQAYVTVRSMSFVGENQAACLGRVYSARQTENRPRMWEQ